MKFLSYLRQGLMVPLRECRSVSVVVCADHSTTVMSGDHSYEPVPVLLCKLSEFHFEKASEDEKDKNAVKKSSKRKRTPCGRLPLCDEVQAFAETEAGFGALGRFPGRELMKVIKSFAAN